MLYFLSLGSEFKSKSFRELCEQRNIKQIYASNEIHAPYVERFNRTIQNIIYKFVTETKNEHFIPHLDAILKTYNGRVHSSIKMTPDAAELKKNQAILVHRAMMRYKKIEEKHKNKQPKFKIGDFVRLRELKTRFQRGYKSSWTPEIFVVDDVNVGMAIPVYYIKDLHGKKIIGTFYDYELSRTTKKGEKEKKNL